jgi:large subunit ribosomal protein L3
VPDRLDDVNAYAVGQEVTAAIFSAGEHVDVIGTSKGKGFAGGIKRWGFKRGPMAHGSKYHRGPGSLQSRAAARVFKGRKLPGRMGGSRVTTQGLQIVRVDPARHMLLIRGALPGNDGSLVIIKDSVKAKGKS